MNILRAIGTVGAMTLISRVFGYLRDMVIAVTFGASGATDAFFVAFRIPNFMRRLFAEGAFAQAFVPIFAEYREQQDRAALRDLLDHTAGTLLAALTLITILGWLAAPWLILVFAPGFSAAPAQHDLASAMLRLTFPYLAFISLTAMAGGILNSIGRFTVPAITPVLLNLSLIGAALWLAPRLAEPVMALAIGVFIAGLAQLALQLPFLARQGLLPRPRLSFAHTGVRRILRLMLPALFGSSVVQINLLFDTLLASLLATGSISWLYYGDRFVELPLALTGIALATVTLPRLSRQQARGDQADFSATLDWALRLGCLAGIPAALGLILLAQPILATLVQYRAFTAVDTQMAALAMVALALGLPAFIGIKVLAPGYYARQDTATPMRIGVYAMAANIGLNILIVGPWVVLALPGPHAGLALATALAAYLNAALLYRGLRRAGVYCPQPGWGRWLLRIIVAGLLMGLVLLWLAPPLSQWSTWHSPTRILALMGLIGLGGLLFGLALLALGLRPGHLSAPAELTTATATATATGQRGLPPGQDGV